MRLYDFGITILALAAVAAVIALVVGLQVA